MNSIRNKFSVILSNPFNGLKFKKLENFTLIKPSHNEATAAIKYATALTVINLYKTYKTIRMKLEGKKPIVKEYSKDTVIIYQFPRGFNTPSMSPFSLKLETWCRAANIKYQNEFGLKTSSQGLVPFIRLNDYQIEDSQKCIEYLSKVYQVNLNSELNQEQKAIDKAVLALCDDSLRWCLNLSLLYSKNARKDLGLSLIAYWIFSYKVYRTSWSTGYGRQTKEELLENSKKSLSALNTLVGNKKYLFSDTKPSDIDFTIFGLIAQVKYNSKGGLNHYLMTDCQNLNRHVENMKNIYWPDWNNHIMSSKVKPRKSLLQRLMPFRR